MPATFRFFRSAALIVIVSAQMPAGSSASGMSITGNMGIPPISNVRIP